MEGFIPEDPFSLKKLSGLWWLPEHKHQCPGTLEFDLQNKHELSVTGSLNNSVIAGWQSHSVIFGLCNAPIGIIKVTIFGAIGSQSTHKDFVTGDFLISGKFKIQEYWAGDIHFANKTDVVFESFNFGLNNLGCWESQDSIILQKHNGRPRTSSMEMVIPEDTLLFSDEYVTITQTYFTEESVSSMGHLQSALRCRPQITIKSNKGNLRYYGGKASFSYYQRFVTQLFQLLLEGRTFTYCLQGWNTFLRDGKRHPITCELFRPQDVTGKQRGFSHYEETLFPYEKIKGVLHTVSENFERHFSGMEGILSTLSLCLHTQSFQQDFPLSNMIFDLEGLQKRFYPKFKKLKTNPNDVSYRQFCDLKKRVLLACPKDLKEFVDHRIKWSIGCLHDRIQAVLRDMCTIFPFLTDEVCQPLTTDIVKIRNHAAHSNEGADITDSKLRLHLILLIQYIQIAIILKGCGVPSKLISECFVSCPGCAYNTIAPFLEKHYTQLLSQVNTLPT